MYGALLAYLPIRYIYIYINAFWNHPAQWASGTSELGPRPPQVPEAQGIGPGTHCQSSVSFWNSTGKNYSIPPTPSPITVQLKVENSETRRSECIMLSQCEFIDEDTQRERNRNATVITGVMIFPGTLNLKVGKIEEDQPPSSSRVIYMRQKWVHYLVNTLAFPGKTPAIKCFPGLLIQ